MARPAKGTENSRGGRLYVRLSAAEQKTFAARAEAAGMIRSDYARRAVLAGRVVVNQTAKADPAVVAQLMRIGVNLNQIARTANATGGVPDNLDQLCRMVEAAVMRAVDREAAGDGSDAR